MPEGLTDHASLSPALDATPSVRELLLQLLGRLKGAPPSPATADVPISVASDRPSIAPAKSAMIHVGPSSVPVDPPMTAMILSQTFWPSSSSQLHGLTGYLQEATTFLVLVEGTFLRIVDDAHMLEHFRHDKQGGEKRFHQYGQFRGPPPQGK